MMLWLVSFTIPCYKTIQEFLRNNVPPLLTIQYILSRFSVWSSCLYFDVSVCSTTHSSLISSSAFCAEVAAAAEEVAKDEKHLAMVEKAGGDFIPLVVECFGVWTPFALSILHSIADRTATRSGISRKVARPAEEIFCNNFLYVMDK